VCDETGRAPAREGEAGATSTSDRARSSFGDPASRRHCGERARRRLRVPLSPSAIRSASKTSVVRMLAASCQPTTIRLNTSITKLE
jgi:hypothetical protein